MKKLKLITESNFDIKINESSQNKNLFIEGVFASAEVKNDNGRIYPREILKDRIDKIQETVKNKNCYGQLNHPQHAEVDLERVSHLVETLEWDGDNVYGRARVLDETPCGATLKGIIKHGLVGISSRGLGTTSFNEERQAEVVNDDFSLITWDCVHNASNPGSRFVNGILEGKEFNLPRSDSQYSYEEVKKYLEESKVKFNPSKLKELIDEGCSLDEIKYYIDCAEKEYYKRIYQVLDEIKKSI